MDRRDNDFSLENPGAWEQMFRMDTHRIFVGRLLLEFPVSECNVGVNAADDEMRPMDQQPTIVSHSTLEEEKKKQRQRLAFCEWTRREHT